MKKNMQPERQRATACAPFLAAACGSAVLCALGDSVRLGTVCALIRFIGLTWSLPSFLLTLHCLPYWNVS
jgi:hypothetical protein